MAETCESWAGSSGDTAEMGISDAGVSESHTLLDLRLFPWSALFGA